MIGRKEFVEKYPSFGKDIEVYTNDGVDLGKISYFDDTFVTVSKDTSLPGVRFRYDDIRNIIDHNMTLKLSEIDLTILNKKQYRVEEVNRTEQVSPLGERGATKKSAFLSRYPDIKEGIDVYSKDDIDLGKIVAMDEDFITIRKGLFFPKDFKFRYDDVKDVQGNKLIMNYSESELADWKDVNYKGYNEAQRSWEEIPLWENGVLNRNEFERKYPNIGIGDKVYTKDNFDLGSIAAMDNDHINLSKGTYFPREFRFRYDDVMEAFDHKIVLKYDLNELSAWKEETYSGWTKLIITPDKEVKIERKDQDKRKAA